MPIYEYSCSKCGEFEVSQRITEDPLKRCPKCRGKVKKLISATSFQLKGSGWYVTDYARKSTEASKDKTAGEPKGEATPAKSDNTSKTESTAKTSEKSGSAAKKTDSSSKGADTKAA